MKNLANCKPSEFFAQTVKIRKQVSEWLSLTKIMEIRKRVPGFMDGMTEEEKKNALVEQAQKNLGAMFDAIFDDNAEKTLELLALVCFVEPDKVDDYDIKYYMQNISEIIASPEVVGFFISLVRLVNKNSSVAVKA